MKIRYKYSIYGTANNGQWAHLSIYASTKQIAQEYASQHFIKAKIEQVG